MRHRRASPTAPVRGSCDEWPDHARPAAPRAPYHRSLTASPTVCPRRCWLLHDGQPGCRTELRPVSTAGGQLHGTGRDALTAAAHARLLAAKQHLDSRSSVRCAPPRPCVPHAPRAFLTAPHPTPTGATRCPDAHRRELSGCGGGVAPCREGRGLSGVYCTQCPEKQARHTAAPRCSHAAAAVLHRAPPAPAMAHGPAWKPIPSPRHLAVRRPAPRRVRLLRRRAVERRAARAAGRPRPRPRRAPPRRLVACGGPCCQARGEAGAALDAPRPAALGGHLPERRLPQDSLVRTHPASHHAWHPA